MFPAQISIQDSLAEDNFEAGGTIRNAFAANRAISMTPFENRSELRFQITFRGQLDCFPLDRKIEISVCVIVKSYQPIAFSFLLERSNGKDINRQLTIGLPR